MIFYVPGHESSAVVTRQQVPHHLSKYKIPFSNSTYTEFEQGNFLSQELKGEGFSFWLHHFFIQEEICIQPSKKKNSLSIHYMRKGTVDCELKPLGRLTLKEGVYHLFCMPSGVKHKVFFQPGHYCSFHADISKPFLEYLSLESDQMDAVMQYYGSTDPVGMQLYEGYMQPRVTQLLEEVQQYHIGDRGTYMLFLQQLLYKLLYAVSKDLVLVPESASDDQDLYRNILAYIKEKIDQKLTLDRVAQEFSISVSRLKRLFYKYIGTSMEQYIVEIRMELAGKYLASTTLSVSDITFLVGYHNESSFCRAFRKYYGIPPLIYRKNKFTKRGLTWN